MITRGRKVRIKEMLDKPYKRSDGKYAQKAKLKCGHITEVYLGYSENHRRSEPKIQFGYCLPCLIADVERPDGPASII